jgi:hypothetical protein
MQIAGLGDRPRCASRASLLGGFGISIFAALCAASLGVRRRNSFGCVCLCAFGRRNLRDCMSVFDDTAHDFVSGICLAARCCVAGRAHCVCEFLCSETGSEVVGCRTHAWSGGESGLLLHPLSVWALWWLFCGCSAKQNVQDDDRSSFQPVQPCSTLICLEVDFSCHLRVFGAPVRVFFSKDKFDERARRV